MKRILLGFACTVLPLAAEPKPVLPTAAFLVKDGATTPVMLHALDGGKATYTLPGSTAKPAPRDLVESETIYVQEPAEYTAAMDLYHAGKFQDARSKFQSVKEHYAPIANADDSYPVLATYYELECLRRSFDLEGLAKSLQGFSKTHLTRGYQQRQLEIDILWDAVRTKSWDRLADLAKNREEAELCPDQRAQVDYCHGLALEGLGKPNEAIACFQTAFATGIGPADEISRAAALRILAIRRQDPDVEKALADASQASPAARGKLGEAVAVATWFQSVFGAALPAEDQVFIKR